MRTFTKKSLFSLILLVGLILAIPAYAETENIEKYNITIISVSHEMNYSFNLHTNVLALNDKRVYFSGKIDVLMNNGLSIAENLFEVPFEKVHLSSGTTVIFPVIN